MAQSTDLMGLGTPAKLADMLANNVGAVTTTGTSSTTAVLLKGSHTYVLTTAASQTGAILSGTETLGDVIYITNTTATTAVIYPPATATFNTSASTSFNLAQYKTGIFIRLTSTTYIALLGT